MTEAEQQALRQRYQALNRELGDVRLLAVSKYAPDAAVQCLIDAGQRQFGEARAQQLRDRAQRWPACAWHMIGPLQKNKAKYIARHAAMWHSCDCLDTAAAVARHVSDRQLPVLIQVNVAAVTGQTGIAPQALPALLEGVQALPALRVAGLMCMGAKGADSREAFAQLHTLQQQLRATGALTQALLCMGMSADYRQAIEAGSDMVRLGTNLFAEQDIRQQ